MLNLPAFSLTHNAIGIPILRAFCEGWDSTPFADTDAYLRSVANSRILKLTRSRFLTAAHQGSRCCQKARDGSACGVGVLSKVKPLLDAGTECCYCYLAHHRYCDGDAGSPHSKRLATACANFCGSLVTAHSGRSGQTVRLNRELSEAHKPAKGN